MKQATARTLGRVIDDRAGPEVTVIQAPVQALGEGVTPHLHTPMPALTADTMAVLGEMDVDADLKPDDDAVDYVWFLDVPEDVREAYDVWQQKRGVPAEGDAPQHSQVMRLGRVDRMSQNPEVEL